MPSCFAAGTRFMPYARFSCHNVGSIERCLRFWRTAAIPTTRRFCAALRCSSRGFALPARTWRYAFSVLLRSAYMPDCWFCAAHRAALRVCHTVAFSSLFYCLLHACGSPATLLPSRHLAFSAAAFLALSLLPPSRCVHGLVLYRAPLRGNRFARWFVDAAVSSIHSITFCSSRSSVYNVPVRRVFPRAAASPLLDALL